MSRNQSFISDFWYSKPSDCDLFNLCWRSQLAAKYIIEQTHGILALFIFRKFILQTRMCRHPEGARCLIFRQTLSLLPYFMCPNSEGSGKTTRMRRFAWAFAGHLCDKYHNLMSWLHWFLETIRPCDPFLPIYVTINKTMFLPKAMLSRSDKQIALFQGWLRPPKRLPEY